VIINIFSARIDVGKKGIDPTSDLGETQLEDTEIVSPLPSKTQGAESADSKNKENSDELIGAEAITECE